MMTLGDPTKLPRLAYSAHRIFVTVSARKTGEHCPAHKGSLYSATITVLQDLK